jgi:hypothetical protein
MTADLVVANVDDDLAPWVVEPRASAEGWRAAYGILEVARLHTGAPRAALYVREAASLRLLALRRIEQDGLDLIADLWARGSLRPGVAWADDARHGVVLPCGELGEIFGVLLLRWEPGTLPHDMAGLPSLARVITTLLQRLDRHALPRCTATGTTTPGGRLDVLRVGSLEREVSPLASAVALRALLEEQEWNVTRVARLLGVTRMTVYNRLRRNGVRRERVFKTANAIRRAAERAPLETVGTPGEPAALAEARRSIG